MQWIKTWEKDKVCAEAYFPLFLEKEFQHRKAQIRVQLDELGYRAYTTVTRKFYEAFAIFSIDLLQKAAVQF
jgi:hypothetical protein